VRVVIASDKFKGSLRSYEVASCIERGIKKVDSSIEVIKLPMADGGEGTVESLIAGFTGKMVTVKVRDPLMREINSTYGIINGGKTAIIEMASSSGLMLLSQKERNPLKTTTYGFGECIKDAFDKGCRDIIIGIGGSATNDGGAGMLQALGARLLDAEENEIGPGSENLSKLETIDISNLDRRIKEVKITVACDVDNPLCGPNGASYVFGFQKGADEEMVKVLDNNLHHFGKIIEKVTGVSIINYPGAGAAGGVGGSMLAFLCAELKKGIDLVIEITKLEEKIREADLVITGEGMIDYQTKFGKTPYGVAKIAKKYNVPVVAIAGSIGEGYEVLYENGFDTIFSIIDKPMTLKQAIRNSETLVEAAAERIIRALLIRLNENISKEKRIS
jgi:glycerate 2-kinase